MKRGIDFSRHIVIDVEATGPCPGYYSLIEIGAVTLDGKEFQHRMRPEYDSHIQSDALRVIGKTVEEIENWPNRYIAMEQFVAWLDMIKMSGDGKLVGWSDNPAFDWQFINHALWCYIGRNPLGHSMRRIGDLWAGFNGRLLETSGWKRMRDTRHSHDALEDARGNAEALRKFLSSPNWE